MNTDTDYDLRYTSLSRNQLNILIELVKARAEGRELTNKEAARMTGHLSTGAVSHTMTKLCATGYAIRLKASGHRNALIIPTKLGVDRVAKELARRNEEGSDKIDLSRSGVIHAAGRHDLSITFPTLIPVFAVIDAINEHLDDDPITAAMLAIPGLLPDEVREAIKFNSTNTEKVEMDRMRHANKHRFTRTELRKLAATKKKHVGARGGMKRLEDPNEEEKVRGEIRLAEAQRISEDRGSHRPLYASGAAWSGISGGGS